MRAGLSTIQQTLTSDAASVLNHSIAEAGRRNHGQTTPLHVAATLLSAPTGFLRQACIRSHPNSSHPLQCRALELCFSVALERLPTAQNMSTPGNEPPISNALMAALKRAQANQRRGCPEQQQQPLLAVKVELEHLIISILDDPSVSRVMREASFSSPAVKSTIEQSLNTSGAAQPSSIPGGNVSFGASFGGNIPRLHSNPVQFSSPVTPMSPVIAPLANRNAYLNPRIQQGGTGQASTTKGEEVKKILEIMARTKKRNPVLVGDAELESVVKEVLRKVENKEMGNDGVLRNAQVVSLDKDFVSNKSQIPSRIIELQGLIESKIKNGGVILDLGDLKWLVEQPVSLSGMQQQQLISETGRSSVFELAKLLAQFGVSNGATEDKCLWLIGTATCETYLRCQVYHSSMENDLDLQAVPIASRSPLPEMFPRLGTERILCSPGEALNASKAVPPSLPALTRLLSVNLDPAQRPFCCLQCSANYEKELAQYTSAEKSFSEANQASSKSSLPQWMRNSENVGSDTLTSDQSNGKDQGMPSKQKTQELEKKWKDTCLHLHPNFHQNNLPQKPSFATLSTTSFNQTLLSRPPFQPKLQSLKPSGETLQLNTNPITSQPKLQTVKPLGETLQLNTNPITNQRPAEYPGSPVQTDLVLGRKESNNILEKDTEDQAKDFLSCISSKPQMKILKKFIDADVDIYKKLLKGLMAKVWWQVEAASSIAAAVTSCRTGNGKRQGGGIRGDVWLLFTGPDRVGKKKMASVLADQICESSLVTICLGSRRDDIEQDVSFRGKTAIDNIAEAIRRNPLAVIMLVDIDEADLLVRGNIKRAIERGRLIDSHGREVGLGNAIFVLTGDWSKSDPGSLRNGFFVDEKKLASTSSGNWQLGLILRDKSAKRPPNWLQDNNRPSRQKTETGSGLCLDLNLAAGVDREDDKTDGSYNSSDLTMNHEDDVGPMNWHFSISSVPQELANNVDASILFKPVDSAFVRQEIKKTISIKFSMVLDDKLAIEVEDDVLDKILGGLWHDRTSLEEWVDNVLSPSFNLLKTRLLSCDRSSSVVRLVIESDSGYRGKNVGNEDWLPRSILV